MNGCWWLLVPATYLFASVSFAWIVARLHGINLRKAGSGNLGATNAGRVLGGRWFAVVFSADLVKGLVPVLISVHLVPGAGTDPQRPWLDLAVAAAAILGHSFTCIHGFRGGKAVATTLGVLIGLVWLTAAWAFAIWLLVWALGALVFRIGRADAVGPASVVAALATPVAHLLAFPQPWAWGHVPVTALVFAAGVLILIRHRSNIGKMLARRRTAGDR